MEELQDFDYIRFQYGKNLHEVFGTILDTFPNIIGPTVNGQEYLWDILQRIKYNILKDIDICSYLTPKYVNGKRNDDYDRMKELLPAICYNACFKGYKNTGNIRTITNLMFLDIDNFPSTENALAYKDLIIGKYDWIVACNLSLSRLGLHVLIMVDLIRDNTDYNHKYDFISAEFFNGRLDKDSKSLTRFTVVPYDFNIYINESPKVLEIERIIRDKEKGIRSTYIGKGITSSQSYSEIGISSGNEEKTLCTPYTFFTNSHIKDIMNEAGRKYKLKFKQEANESLFQDPDIPLYFHEGVDIIRINLFPYRDCGVKEGHRHSFIGALSVQLLFLNSESPKNVDPDIKNEILKFLIHLNKKICDPPLTYKQVLKYFNWNCLKYESGEIDISRYFHKQRAFWSKKSILKGNEKRKVTCKIKNEPIVNESKRKIREAIKTIEASGEKITQPKVAKISGLGLSTVKKYKDYFNDIIKKKKMNTNYTQSALFKDKAYADYKEVCNVPSSTQEIQISEHDINSKNLTTDSIEEKMQVENTEDSIFVMDATYLDDGKFLLSDEQINALYNRIFNSLINRIDKDQEKVLYAGFVNRFNNLPQDDKRLLTLPTEKIDDNNTFWKQSSLESKFWELCNGIHIA
jgi:hypothetical protein